MVSAGWFDQDGVVRASDFGRGSLRFNLDQDLGPQFRLGTRASYSRSVGNQDRVNAGYGSGGGAVTAEALRFAPTIPVYDSAGNFSGPLFPSQTMDNPVAIVNLLSDKTTTDYLIGSLFGEYDLVPGLTLRSSLSYTSRNVLEQQYASRLLRAALGSGQANIDNNDQTTWLSENTVTLHRTLGGTHDFALLGGFPAQQTRTGTNSEQGVGFTSDELGYKRLNLAETVTGSSSSSRTRQPCWWNTRPCAGKTRSRSTCAPAEAASPGSRASTRTPPSDRADTGRSDGRRWRAHRAGRSRPPIG